MMVSHAVPVNLIDIPWMAFVIYWAVKAAKTRETKAQEPLVSRYLVMLILLCGYSLVFSPRARIGFLAKPFVPNTLGVMGLGIALTWLGIMVAIWARYHLAEYWSARVTIKMDHQLIRTGPYARMRHPIYSGLLLATLGTALAIGEWRGLVALGLALIAYSIKAKREEAMLAGQFGSAFEEHRRHTGFLLPRLR
jgi:protein-S-isoprenylcysteine O-methyltransferase Ste14